MREISSVLKNFLENRRILIVDVDHSSKNRLASSLTKIGCPKDNIFLCSDASQALDIGVKKSIGIIISSDEIGLSGPYELFKELRQKLSKMHQATCILIASNLSQSLVAKAAEEGVDSIILRPYTMNLLIDNLNDLVEKKVNPSTYLSGIKESEKLIENEEFSKASSILFDLIAKEKNPSLAHYYSGLIKEKLGEIPEAIKHFEEASKKNKFHIKSLDALFNAYKKDGSHLKAYSMGKDLLLYFPDNVMRFNDVIRLAIITKAYDDFRFIYDSFKKLKNKDSSIVKFLCSGLFISGKFYLYKGNDSEAKKFFDMIAESFSAHSKFLKVIIETLVEFGKYNEAINYLGFFSDDKKQDLNYQVSEFLITHEIFDTEELTDRAEEFINNGAESFVLYRKLIKGLYLTGGKIRAEKHLEKAKEIWKEHAQTLDKIRESFSENAA